MDKNSRSGKKAHARQQCAPPLHNHASQVAPVTAVCIERHGVTKVKFSFLDFHSSPLWLKNRATLPVRDASMFVLRAIPLGSNTCRTMSSA